MPLTQADLNAMPRVTPSKLGGHQPAVRPGSLLAISLWQPWASGVALGLKANETRHWFTRHRGEIAIHAAKRWEADQRDFAENARRAYGLPWQLPFGAIVAVANIADIKRTEQLLPTLSEKEADWGDYGPGRYAWQLTNVRPLAKPVPCKGRQAIWMLDEAVTAAVREQLA